MKNDEEKKREYYRKYRETNRELINARQKAYREKKKQVALEDEAIKCGKLVKLSNKIVAVKQTNVKKCGKAGVFDASETNAKQIQDQVKQTLGTNETKKFRGIFIMKLKKTLKKQLSKYLKAILLICLIALFTYFLVSEAKTFYAMSDKGGGDVGPLLKALIGESALLTLSFMRCSDFWTRICCKILLFSLICYSTYSVAGGVFTSGKNEIEKVENIESNISLLREEIKNKEDSIRFFREKNWPNNVRRLEREVTELRASLSRLSQSGLLSKNMEVAEANMFGLIIFRILIQLTNLLLASRLGRIFS